MSWALLRLALLGLAGLRAWAVPIDNGVLGYPEVTCGPHSIRVDLSTQKPFRGRLFVKGESQRGDCVRPSQDGPGYGPAAQPYGAPPPDAYGPTSVGIQLKFGECNMRRQRTLYPRGVEYTFTLVASFHPLFITKVDRAYRVRCFYMEAEKTVSADLDVSMLTTGQLNEQFPMPQCYYHLKRSHDGPYVRYAKVGDKLTHSWECGKVAGYVYGMLVKNCYVDDGQGNKVELLDAKGCPVDRHLLPQLTYDDHHISAHVQTHVFKYADRSHLFFQCSIQLCVKSDGGCEGITPPDCGYQEPSPHPHEGPVHGGPLHQTHPGLPRSGSSHGGPSPIQPPSSYQPPPPSPYGPPPPHSLLPPPPPPAQGFQGPFGPYQQDDPLVASSEETNATSSGGGGGKASAKTKRALAEASPMEADLAAPSLIVLPFEEAEEEGREGPTEELGRLLSLAPAAPPGVCLSHSGFAILVALFASLFLFGTSLALLLFKKLFLPKAFLPR